MFIEVMCWTNAGEKEKGAADVRLLSDSVGKDSLLLCDFGFGGLNAIFEVVTGVLTLELFHAASRIDESLLAREVGVRA